jgi:hypothetical protein
MVSASAGPPAHVHIYLHSHQLGCYDSRTHLLHRWAVPPYRIEYIYVCIVSVLFSGGRETSRMSEGVKLTPGEGIVTLITVRNHHRRLLYRSCYSLPHLVITGCSPPSVDRIVGIPSWHVPYTLCSAVDFPYVYTYQLGYVLVQPRRKKERKKTTTGVVVAHASSTFDSRAM